MARQLSPGRPAIDGAAAPASAPASTRPGRTSARQSVRDFVSAHAPSAQAASQATGIPQRFLLAQAALESGWGRREIRGADGAASHNLFGIKAGADWAGRVVEAPTTEYVNGKAVKTVARFRADDSDAESFADNAKLIAGSARYASVRGARDEASFAYGLQRAGYATDPQYADKVMRVISGIAASGVRTA
jgi:flagellar protein FlgJ